MKKFRINYYHFSSLVNGIHHLNEYLLHYSRYITWEAKAAPQPTPKAKAKTNIVAALS